MIFALKMMDFVLKVMNFGRLPRLSFERQLVRWGDGLWPQHWQRVPRSAADPAAGRSTAAAPSATSSYATADHAAASWMQRFCGLEVPVADDAGRFRDERLHRSHGRVRLRCMLKMMGFVRKVMILY